LSVNGELKPDDFIFAFGSDALSMPLGGLVEHGLHASDRYGEVGTAPDGVLLAVHPVGERVTHAAFDHGQFP